MVCEEHKPGKKFELNGKRYQAEINTTHSCISCAFQNRSECDEVLCLDSERSDGNNVIFKEVSK